MATSPKSSSTATSQRRAQRRSTATFKWRHATCKLTVRHDCIETGWSNLELTVVAPKGAPLPLTTTGYFAHYMAQQQLEAAGGAAAFMTDWLDREAKTKAWHATEFRWRQLDLFATAPKRRC